MTWGYTLLFILGIVISIYLIYYLLQPRVRDEYFPIYKEKFANLKYVGLHAKDISLDNIPYAIQEMRQIYQSNITKPLFNRKEQLKNLLKMMQDNESLIIEAIEKDLGRRGLLAIGYDILPLVSDIKKFINNLSSYSAAERLPISLITFPSIDYLYKDPYGTVFINGIWNFPILLSLAPLAGAIAAGNNVVLKPCNTSIHCSQLLCDLLHKYIDSRFVTVLGGPHIEDDRIVTSKILESKFDYIFFTGSTNGGKFVMKAASNFLTPVCLELGGKNPVIVDSSADVNAAVKQCLFGRVINCGQQCIAPDYVLCHEKVIDEFCSQCEYWSKKFFPNDFRTDFNQAHLINDTQFERVRNMLKSTKGKTVCGGLYDEVTRKFQLTVVRVNFGDPSLEQETFGPILWVVPIKNIEEGINFINSKNKPLSLYLFTNDKTTRNLVIHNTSSGGLMINGTIAYAGHTHGRFGGVGDSGMGAYHGKTTFDLFSHKKIVVRSLFENTLLYPPWDTLWKIKLFRLAF